VIFCVGSPGRQERRLAAESIVEGLVAANPQDLFDFAA